MQYLPDSLWLLNKKTLGQQGYTYNLIWIKRRISNALSEVGSASEMRID